METPTQTHWSSADDTAALIKGKIVELAFWMKKQGYADTTTSRRIRLLSTLAKRGANLNDPESVKTVLANHAAWSPKTKELVVEAYTCFLKMLGTTWTPPKYQHVRKLPFIPTEQETNELIAGCNRRTATFLQLLKETGMRCGEAWMLQWTDLNLAARTVNVTPEKGSEPRQLPLSERLIAMLNALDKTRPPVFTGSLIHFARSYRRQRRRIAITLKNERINKVTFHTFRHFKATMLYAKTKDILYVQKTLGHRSIQNTLLYTQLVHFKNDEYHSATATTPDEAQKLVEAGFEFVCGFDDGVKLFRKPK